MSLKWSCDKGIACRLLGAGLSTVLLISALWAVTLGYFLHKADRAILERRLAGQTHVQIYKVESEKYEFQRDFLTARSKRLSSKKEYEDDVRGMEDSADRLIGMSAPADQALVQALIRMIGQYRTQNIEFLALHHVGRLDHPKWRSEGDQLSDRMDQILDGMEDPIERLVARTSERLERSRRQLLWAGIILLLLGIVKGAAVFYAFARSITRPLIRLKDAAMQVGDGHLDTVIDVQSPGEVGSLAKAFQAMVQNVKRNQAVAIQSEKMAAVGQFAAGVAHDINNPVGVILGFAQSLLRRFPENAPMRMPLESIEREAQRCKVLVQDLLTFSRSNKPTTTIKMENLSKVVEGALSLVATLARSKQVELVRCLASDLPPIPVDSGQIQQAVINLCTNAIDAMSKGGKLTVALSRRGNHAEIAVQDTGTGIPLEIREKIFEAFFTTKEEGKGTGLGLSLIANIAKAHQGEIALESELGKGSTFTLRLPINPTPIIQIAA